MKLPFMHGLGLLRNKDGTIKTGTREEAQRLADKLASQIEPKGTWSGAVFETDEYFRINAGRKC